MIDAMKKIMIACLEKERQSAVSKLQSLGIVHVVNQEEPSSDEIDATRRSQEQLARVMTALGQTESLDAKEDRAADALIDEALKAMETLKVCADELGALQKQQAQLAPWGSFSRKSLETLKAHGMYVELCTASASRLPELPEGAALKIISQENGVAWFAVISREPLDSLELPLAQIPEITDMNEIRKRQDSLRQQENAARIVLESIAQHYRPTLQKRADELAEKMDFLKAREGMATGKAIAYLGGYVPANKIDQLREAAHANGWAIHYEDVPEDDTDAPTNLIIPKPFRMARWIFDFVGILPGYHETDVSISVLVFLSIFCGLLVGDAGYGTIFTAIVLYFRSKVKDPKNREGMNLLLVMSLCILGYGALSGNWFAIPSEKLPRLMHGLPWLSDSALSQKHVQILCFFIGAFHMAMAHAWCALKACLTIKPSQDGIRALLGKLRGVLGNLGWGIFLWGNYGLAKLLIVDGGEISALPPMFRGFYAIGTVMILLFSINWLNIGDVIYMPFTFVNSFVDLLSYIRLFAVGLSGVYIADSFNGMASDLCKISPWMIPFGLLVIFFGHLLNVALACMGVLVHGIRLNTLEFSGHMNISWGGKAYRPLKKS